MAEDQTTDEVLFDTSKDEDGSPNVSTTKDQLEEVESTSEENEEGLDLDESKSSQEEVKQRQIDAWYRKIKSEEKSLDELPKNQKWMKPFLEARLEAETSKEKKKESLELSSLVQEELQALKGEDRYQELKASLNELKLTSEQKAIIQEEFKRLVKNMPKDEALDTARRLAGVDQASRKAAMTPPTPNTVNLTADGDITVENFREKLSHDDPRRIEMLDRLTDPSHARSQRWK